MRYLVIIPALPEHAHYAQKALDYFESKGVRVRVILNGPGSTLLPGRAVEFFSSTPHTYKARNWAVNTALSDFPDLEGVFLTDADCIPHEGTHEAILESLHPRCLVAGKTDTAWPDTSRHFKLMNGLEVYDGYEHPGTTYGANMLIGRETWEENGPFVTGSVSGGDNEFATRWKAKGGTVTINRNIWVSKFIHGMTFKGICEKQIRRGSSACAALLPSQQQCLKNLRAALFDQWLTLHEDLDSPEAYKKFLDVMFKLQYFYGELSQHFDKE